MADEFDEVEHELSDGEEVFRSLLGLSSPKYESKEDEFSMKLNQQTADDLTTDGDLIFFVEEDDADETEMRVSQVTPSAPVDLSYLTEKSYKKPFYCHICDYRTTRKTVLSMHMSKHTGEKPFACEFCPYRGRYQGQLKSHIRGKHSNEKPFACDKCEYRAARKSSLNYHLKTHTGERPYSCKTCGYRGVTMYRLRCHMKTHARKRLYRCRPCNFESETRSSFLDHFKTHAPPATNDTIQHLPPIPSIPAENVSRDKPTLLNLLGI